MPDVWVSVIRLPVYDTEVTIDKIQFLILLSRINTIQYSEIIVIVKKISFEFLVGIYVLGYPEIKKSPSPVSYSYLGNKEISGPHSCPWFLENVCMAVYP